MTINSRLPAMLLLAGTLALHAMPGQAHEDDEAWRLFIADHTTGRITALELAHSEKRWSFEVKGPAKLYASETGQAVIAVQSDDDEVAFLSSGISLKSHGDHADIVITEPTKIDAVLTGPRPFHVVSHAGFTAINFDKGGYATLLSEAEILEGRLNGLRFPQARAHHGFVAGMKDYIISSVASPDATVKAGDPAPRIGAQSFRKDGTAIGSMQTCTDLHGEAFSGEFLLTGCKEGVVAIRDRNGQAEFAMLPYPKDLPAGNTGTLLGSTGMQIFLGNYGAQGLVVIDPTEAPYFQYLELPFRRVDFILDPARPQFGYALTEDGVLHRIDLLQARIERSVQVTKAYSMEGHWRDPRPRLAIADEHLVLTDPKQSSLLVLDSESLKEEARIAVDGLPYNIIAIGGSGVRH